MNLNEKDCPIAAVFQSGQTDANQSSSQTENASKQSSRTQDTTPELISGGGKIKAVVQATSNTEQIGNGAALLYSIVAVLKRYILFEEHKARAVALFIVLTWCYKAFKIAPILNITAAEKRCGKSQLLRIILYFCFKPLKADNITAAAMFRVIELRKPTLLIDEADQFLKNNAEMIGILNAGFEADGTVIRLVGDNHEPKEFNVFCPKVIAGIGQIPSTVKSRSIVIELNRMLKTERLEHLRHADSIIFEQLKCQIEQWVTDNFEALQNARPQLPSTLNCRAQDCWEPLFAIADQAGGNWSQFARDAAIAISGLDEDALSINEELLTDISRVFSRKGVRSIATHDLLIELCLDTEAPWATWHKGKSITAHQLAARLREFGIKSKQLRFGQLTCKGYEKESFLDAFNRYIGF